MNKFAINLKRLKKEHGWNQKDLANKLGLSQPMISDLETGKYNPIKKLEEYAAKLGVAPEELVK